MHLFSPSERCVLTEMNREGFADAKIISDAKEREEGDEEAKSFEMNSAVVFVYVWRR